MKNLIKIRTLASVPIFLGAFLTEQTYGQKNPDIPRPRGPVDLSDTANLVMFIILPALVIIGFFFWRNAAKKRKEE